MNERPTFSPFWPRIRALCPRLRPHVQITRQRYRGRRWHVVHDPTRNSFYRLNPVAYDLVCTLDGVRTVEQAWYACLEKFGDAAPMQGEVIELVSQLFSRNLLAIDIPPETEQLLRRGTERAKKRVLQQAVGIMYFRLKLLNPEPILRVLEPIVRPLLSKAGLVLWVVAVFGTLAFLGSRWRDLVAGFDSYILGATASSFGWMIAVFVAIKAWHELGHGLLCKRFGGQVPEAGVFMLVLFPAPYVDASSCWAFPNKWQRIIVASGGMMFELLAASLAAWLWMSSSDGTLLKSLSYYAMVTASVSTLVFNINPLMRFDGYYILSDLLEVPNLAQRSQQMLQYLFQRYVYRVRSPRSPSSLPGERVILAVYGIASLAYRMLLFVTIILFILGMAFAVGLVLAVWSIAAWFILPVGKFVHWHATSSALADMRWRAAATSIGLCALAAVLVGVLRLPDYRRAGGVVESERRTAVYFGTEGFVAVCHVRPGAAVKAGDPIVTLQSPELESLRLAAKAQIDELSVRQREAVAADDPGSVQIAEHQLAVWRQQAADLEDRVAKLVVRAPQDGVMVGPDPARLLAALVKTGQPVALIVDPTRLRIVASLSQVEASWLFSLKPGDYEVLARPVSSPLSEPIHGTGARAVPAGSRELAHGSMGITGGGDVEVSADEPSGRKSKREQFTVYIDAPAESLAHVRPGERVFVRFELPSRSLVDQVVDRVRRTLQGRVHLLTQALTRYNALYSSLRSRANRQLPLNAIDRLTATLALRVRSRRISERWLRNQAELIDAAEPEVRNYSEGALDDGVSRVREAFIRGRADDEAVRRALALVREVARRETGQEAYVVQLMGALALYHGRIIEMLTGEGKTLTGSIVAPLIAWRRRHLHVLTVNDYLAARDAESRAGIYKRCLLECGAIVQELDGPSRFRIYAMPIVYGTPKQITADFLRDQLRLGVTRSAWTGRRAILDGANADFNTLEAGTMIPGLHAALVDEADAVLIDEGVTPLIIAQSRKADDMAPVYTRAAEIARTLQNRVDFTMDKLRRRAELTKAGIQHARRLIAECPEPIWRADRRALELVRQALIAGHCYRRGGQYLIVDGRVMIVDEYTGRVLPDRSWEHGLHQAVEAKEGVEVTADRETLVRLSFQKFFRMYPFMCGMTGTAADTTGEMVRTYLRPVSVIPTNRPVIRERWPTRVFRSSEARWSAVVESIVQLHRQGRPVLAGTRSVHASELLSTKLTERNLTHRVLNANFDKEEASLISGAGEAGAITVATNMAGRGTDILLDHASRQAGGLHVLLTEMHGAKRIDRQFIGRAGRQGDPGSSQMFVSLEDELVKLHAPRAALVFKGSSSGEELKGKRLRLARVLFRFAQHRSEARDRRNRVEVLRQDDWIEKHLPGV